MANYLNHIPSSEIIETKKLKSLFIEAQKGRKPKENPSLKTRIIDLTTKIPRRLKSLE